MIDLIKVVNGNITEAKVDAIVNAANSSLLGGGGVDGAIHKAAGPLLYEECKQLQGCATSDAKLTAGHDIPVKHIIHTVGPIWRDGKRAEEAKLALCYSNCLKLAQENGVKTIAFPAISTGAYGFPIERAATTAIDAIRNFDEGDGHFEEVQLICLDPVIFKTYQEALQSRKG